MHIFKPAKKEGTCIPLFNKPLNFGFLKNRQTNPVALNKGRAPHKRIQLTIAI